MTPPLNSAEYLRDIVLTAVVAVTGELVKDLDPNAPDPGPRAVPRDLRLWLARLRLLEGVPFGHLVADPTLLPPESIRFFHLDRGWTDALVEGALSVGTVTTADRAALEGLYGVVREETDEAERLLRLPGWEPGAAVPTGPAGPLSGFVLRSRMVSGWPALHVRAYARDNLRLSPKVNDDAVGEEHDADARQARRCCGWSGSRPPCCWRSSTASRRSCTSRSRAPACSSASTRPAAPRTRAPR